MLENELIAVQLNSILREDSTDYKQLLPMNSNSPRCLLKIIKVKVNKKGTAVHEAFSLWINMQMTFSAT